MMKIKMSYFLYHYWKFNDQMVYYNKILDTSNNTQYFRYTEIIQYGFHYIKKHIDNSVYL